MADDTGLRQRGERWQARVSYVDMSGKRRTLTETCATKTEARSKRDKMRSLRDSGQNIGTGKESLAEYLEKWLTRREKRGGLSPLTTEAYRRYVERHIVPIIGGVELRRLNAEHVERFLDALGETPHHRTGEPISAQTQLHAFRVLHKALEDAMRQGLIAANPCHLVDAPSVERHEEAALSAAQVKTLVDAMDDKGPDWLYMATVLGVTTGLRRGEVLALTWANVDIDQGVAQIERSRIPAKGGAKVRDPKTKASQSVIRLPHGTITALKAYKARQSARRLEAGSMWKDEGLVICNDFGAAVSPSHLSRKFTEVATGAGLDVHFHSLRHTFASLHHDAGAPLKELQELMRHASPDLVMRRYAHTQPGSQESAAARLDEVLKDAL